MAQHRSSICTPFRRGAALSLLACAALLHGATGQALTRAELYQATAPLADRSEPALAAAFQTALRSVLVRVTGRRNADSDAALSPLYGSARRYVQQYRAAADGQVSVSFDGASIDRWLTQNGQPVWGYERPSTLVWLMTQGASPTTAEDMSELKTAIEAAAAARGVPLVWPSAADAQRAGVTPLDVAHRLGAEGVLAGKAAAPTAAAAPAAVAVRWTFQYQDRVSEFAGALEGVNRAADTYAGLFAASGAVVPVDIEVSGVEDLKSYAALQAYLDTVTVVSHVSVQSLSGDVVRFRLAARGGTEALQHTLALGGRLLPAVAGENGMPRFQVRH